MTMQRIVPPYTQNIIDETDIGQQAASVSGSLDLGTLPIRLSTQFVITDAVAAKTFVNTAVDDTAHTITIPAHGYVTGLEVDYNVNSGTTLTNLVDDTNYFVIKVDADTIKLALSYNNAVLGTAIAIAGNAVAGNFTLTPVAPAGTAKSYGSNDATNWTELDSDTFSATASYFQELPTVSFRYVKMEVAVTAGQVDVLAITHTKL